MWYEKSFRRHLCDMHIDDWNEEFLSKFSPDTYLENLKKANIQNAMLYFQSHVGLCYYPTKSGKMHNAWIGKEDQMQSLARMCRNNSIAVTGYYSLIYNNWAHQKHPEWRMVDAAGNSRVWGKDRGIFCICRKRAFSLWAVLPQQSGIQSICVKADQRNCGLF